MLNNNKKSRSDDISVIDVLLALWKDKKLLSLMSMFFTFLGFMYSLTLNKNIELSSTVVVKEHPRQFFANYEPFFDDNVIDFGKICSLWFGDSFQLFVSDATQRLSCQKHVQCDRFCENM